MKYSELIDFEPITTVIQIKEAEDKARARELVKTFVVSPNMEETLCDLIFPHLQFTKPFENKGLLIVGNYGTGKSHVMSVISSLAEDVGMLPLLENKKVSEGAKDIAGKFKVVRSEIGGVAMPLRDIVLTIIETDLRKLGIEYTFPSAERITNNKESLIEMMALFNKKFPNMGYLIIIDELLDYLLSRSDQGRIYDLNFLREVGETCRNSRLRFVAGVQESLFENPKFNYVSSTLLKVKDRFEQVRIKREDVSFVVSERILKKNKTQRALIKDHLEKFIVTYPIIGKQIDTFVDLYPIHPAYLEIFEKLYIAEKREILKVISQEIDIIKDTDVPDDAPGIITYDSYWKKISSNPAIRAIPDVKRVIDTNSILERYVRQSFPKPQYKETALRIVYALGIQRLTTDNYEMPLGPTIEELRDGLCPVVPNIPERDADFLNTTLETIVKDIMRTVNGQYITFNKDNGQLFLDLKKIVDYDGQIENKMSSLDENVLDRYYYEVLIKAMECSPTTYVPNYRIWEYEVEWKEKRTMRLGYLFFGAPNQRSTAQPPRDFYIYFIQPFDPPKFKDERRPDEVFFILDKQDPVFNDNLKHYAASRELEDINSPPYKDTYHDKSEYYSKKTLDWIRTHLTSSYSVMYDGASKRAVEWSKSRLSDNIRDIVNAVSSACLAPHFRQKFPDYPVFSNLVTSMNRKNNANEALRYICGKQTLTGRQFCEDLNLIDDKYVVVNKSQYAIYFMNMLKTRGAGQVINRNEILQGAEGAETDIKFQLEPEWIGVILAALAYGGEISISLQGKKVDASNLDHLLTIGIDGLLSFKHIELPKELPISTLKTLSRALGIPEGRLTNESTREEWVRDIQEKTGDYLKVLAKLESDLNNRFVFSGTNVFTEIRKTEILKTLSDLKTFFSNLQIFNTPGKLKNYRDDAKKIDSLKEGLALIESLNGLQAFIADTSSIASYLENASSILNKENNLKRAINSVFASTLDKLRDEKIWTDDAEKRSLSNKLNECKADYIRLYLDLHKKSRLDLTKDRAKRKLLDDERYKQLVNLANIKFMPKTQLDEYVNKISALKTCFSLFPEQLESRTSCPACNFRPDNEPIYPDSIMETLEEDLEKLHSNWTGIIIENLNDPSAKSNLELMSPKQRASIDTFIQTKQLPNPITNEFVQAVNDAFQGLIKIELTTDDIKSTLLEGGVPCSVDEFAKRFTNMLDEKCIGKDKQKIRVIVK